MQLMLAAYRPGTWANHRSNVAAYLAFCTSIDQTPVPINTVVIQRFILHLSKTRKTSQSILNIISSIKFLARLCGSSIQCFESIEVDLLMKAIKLQLPKACKARTYLDPEAFKQLCMVTNTKTFGVNCHAYRLGFLLGYLGLLRRANIAPESQATYDPTRHTSKKDVQIKDGKVIVTIKWTKTRQNNEKVFVILPVLKQTELNAAHALTQMNLLAQVPCLETQPLLTFVDGHVITANFLSTALVKAVQAAGLSMTGVTLHSLRRGGTSAAQQGGAEAPQLSKHGTWESDTWKQYLLSNPSSESPVQQAMQSVFDS